MSLPRAMNTRHGFVVGLCAILIGTSTAPLPCAAGAPGPATAFFFNAQALMLRPAAFPEPRSGTLSTLLFRGATVLLGLAFAFGGSDRWTHEQLWELMLVVA